MAKDWKHTAEQAIAYGQGGQFERAIPLFRKALRSAGEHPGLRLALARALALHGDMGESQREAEHAIGAASHPAPLLAEAARVFEEAAALELSRSYWSRVFENGPNSPEAALEYARLSERLNRLDEAETWLTRAQPLDSHPSYGLIQARLWQRRGDHARALEGLARLAEQTRNGLREQALAGMVVSADALGDFERAWHHASLRYASLYAQKEVYTAPPIAPGDMTEPRTLRRAPWRQVVILTGYPRSGTTLTGRILAGQPGVAYADESLITTQALARLNGGGPSSAGPHRDYYTWGMKTALAFGSDDVLIDKNPAVCGALASMQHLLPEMRVLWCRRDPRDILVSCYLSAMPPNPFTATFRDPMRLAQHIVAVCRNWIAQRTQLGDDAWREVSYEQVAREGAAVVHGACDDWAGFSLDAALDYRAAAQKAEVNSPTYAEVIRPITASRVGRWKRYAPYCKDAMAYLAETLPELLDEEGQGRSED